MDIWHWVGKLNDELIEAGQGESVRTLETLTDHICDLEIEQADALVPEARALCKTLGNPWMEVFVRHWEMRNRVGNKLEGESALADAVSLFELAHREDTLECPQAVCVTQDLASCYANIDGPGWVAERIEVCEETLARIDPSWNCYQCLSNEQAEALLDDDRPLDALAFLERQERHIEAAGESAYDSVHEMRMSILIALDRDAEALALIEAMEAKVEGAEWKNVSQPRELLKALALAKLERDDEAWPLLMPLADVAPRYRVTWIKALYLLLQRMPARNTWTLGGELQATLDHLSRHGAHRHLITTGVLCAQLALQRGALWTARRTLALARRHQPKLNADRGADDLLNALEAAIQSAPDGSPPPVPAEQLLAWLEARGAEGGSRNPETEAEWLLHAVARRPDDTDLLAVAASALQACAAHDEAIELLWRYAERHDDSEQPVIFQLLHALLERGDQAGVERLAALFEARAPQVAAWCQAKLAQRLGDWPALEAASRRVLAVKPELSDAHFLLAHALMRQARFAEAADCYLHLSHSDHEDTARSALWDYMTAASAAENWDAVRQGAQRIGMTLSSDSGPVEEEWGWVIIRYIENGEALDYYAQRTGPVTARILENAGGGRVQHVGDRVVFDAAMLVAPPEDPEQREHFVATYGQVHTLKTGEYGASWFFDGVHPGEEAFAGLRDALDARGWNLWVHSAPDYRLEDSEDPRDEPLPGVFFTLAAPESLPSLALHQAMEDLTRDWPHRLCWLRLAEHCGADPQPHLEAIERYGL
ncbi:hypothetical protein [Pseudomonas sp. RIT-PI-AD]|uniref:hypothetical protein n=1 Tax=Pseudomonas sp. RIT-PI-AD TaxID=3035294 RepID=UPI0021DB4838|nr:hypothetical protein [Pseudomonas sp. RIT-PI-AD]